MLGGTATQDRRIAPKGWREELLDRLLISIAPLLTAAVAMAAAGFAGSAGLCFAEIVGPFVLLVWVMTFARRAPYKWRAASLVALFVVATFAGYALSAFHGNAVLVSASGVITAGLLFGRRPMLWVLAAVLLAPALAAGGMLGGLLPQPAADTISSARLGPWVRTTLVGGCLFSTFAFAITFVVERIERALDEQRVALDELRAEQARRELAEAQQRDAERAMLQAQKMEVIGQLAAGVAHDFNNVLVVIQGWAELGFLADTTEAERAEAREALDVATRQGAALARQLLALGRKNVRARRRFVLEAAVQSNMRALRSILPEDILVSVEHERHAELNADETEVQQLLFNLVLNARDAMPSGGKLTIRTGLLESDTELAVVGDRLPAGRWAFLRVEDTGSGIPLEIQSRVFEPFFTTKALGAGTGLGLATVLGIASEAHGGIVLESSKERGTALTVYLPEADADAIQPSDAPERRPRLHSGPARILLLEDDTHVRQLIQAILSRDGHEVVAASDGRHALAEIAKSGPRFDLLCTDAVVPHDPARRVIEAFEAANPGAPVLVVSGYVQEQLTRRGIEEGRYRLLHKPFRPEELASAVDDLLGLTTVAPQPVLAAASRVW